MLQSALENLKNYKNIVNHINDGVIISGLCKQAKAHLLSCIVKEMGRPIIFVTYNEIESINIFSDFETFLDDGVIHFPSRAVQLMDVDASSIDNRRVDGIYSAIKGKSMVASIDALLPCLAPKSLMLDSVIKIKVDDTFEIEDLKQKLVMLGYRRKEKVDNVMAFAVRGDILDICFKEDIGYRIEFFDNVVFSIKTFDLETQRSLDVMKKIEILPMVETPINEKAKIKLYEMMKEEIASLENNVDIASTKMVSRLDHLIDSVKQGVAFSNIENFAGCMYPDKTSIFDYYANPIIVFDEPNRILERLDSLSASFNEKFVQMFEKGQALKHNMDVLNFGVLDKLNKPYIGVTMFDNVSAMDFKIKYPMDAYATYIKADSKPEFILDLKTIVKKDYKTYVFCGNEKRANRFVKILGENDIVSTFSKDVAIPLKEKQIVCLPYSLTSSFEYTSLKLAFVSDGDVEKRPQKQAKKKKQNLDIFIDLQEGCFVVHEIHGIGRYLGIKTVNLLEKSRDYVLIEYAGKDKLYLPTDEMDRIQKYVGVGDSIPKLSKMGGADWDKIKTRVKKSVEDMAEDLVNLYATRSSKKGFAFSPDSSWQKEFEDSFVHEETEDQLKCVEEIKGDMEAGSIMDRLLCGDVGYGKTEVAIRAMFKCVTDSLQCAILVPTTILASQHFETLKARMAAYPITVELLSRFRTAKEQKEILRKLKSGEIDIVVGTHKLLSKDVVFKNLGLLVVDEEQRFGVKHKETIKGIKQEVDVLTLSATPIPRTLYMSLIGIRDMSVINTPPQFRHTVQTYVMEYSPDVIKEAILDEIGRQGQVYFLYNDVRNMEKMKHELNALVPEARIAIGHGQMGEVALEKVMMDFYNGEIDVLLCSTIIESGLDVENANTLIVYDADNFGLSQLYQLRGRVGRSTRQAYGYFTYRKNMSEKAEKRLSAIRDFTEFGSGFKIAMRDLEIRGAGNVLGSEQCGHMTQVGYDMYCRLVGEAVDRIKGVVPKVQQVTNIKIDANAYIPDTFIHDENSKIEIYKKISYIRDEADVEEVKKELLDRFSKIPRPVENLLAIALIKSIANNIGFESVVKERSFFKLVFFNKANIDHEKIMGALKEYGAKRMKLTNSLPFAVNFRPDGKDDDDNLYQLLMFIKKLI